MVMKTARRRFFCAQSGHTSVPCEKPPKAWLFWYNCLCAVANSGHPGRTPRVTRMNVLGGVSGLLMPSAKGNVFTGPGISAYSGQIVSKPTLFPFAKGIGLMGEAGAEAVVPLTRTPSGRLGVESVGGYKQSAPVINVQVVNQTSAKANPQVTTTTNRDGSMSMRVVLNGIFEREKFTDDL